MYKKYKVEKIEKARRRRQEGLSLKEISIIMRIPKGTIGNWVRDIELNDEQKKRLKEKEKKVQNNLKIYSVIMRNKSIIKHKNWYQQGMNMELEKEDLIGLILYAAEGTHSIKSTTINMANSQPEYIKRFLEMMERIFNISKNKFSMKIALHEYHNKEKSIEYWRNKTGIENIKILDVRSGKRKIRTGYMGTAHVSYCNIEIRCKLEGLIDKYTGRKYPIGIEKI